MCSFICVLESIEVGKRSRTDFAPQLRPETPFGENCPNERWSKRIGRCIYHRCLATTLQSRQAVQLAGPVAIAFNEFRSRRPNAEQINAKRRRRNAPGATTPDSSEMPVPLGATTIAPSASNVHPAPGWLSVTPYLSLAVPR